MRLDRRWSTTAAVLLAAVVLFSLLGHRPLTDWDEGIYAEVSREMLSGGWRAWRDWITPHWNGQLWFEKPPLMLWITATFFRVFGVTEFWARAGSALSGVAIVGVLHRWLIRREGLLAAWIGTVALLSTMGFLHICRVGEMDALLSLGCVVALLGLAAVRSERPSGWYGFWFGFAVAAMTKGSASVVLPMTAIALGLAERWDGRRFGREFSLGLLAFAGLVLPWHLAMWRLYEAAFAREYFGFHVLARATRAIEGHETPWWYYGQVLLLSAMPWVLILPVATVRRWRRVELRVWIIFMVVVVGFFSVVQTRLPHYVAPVYPAIAVLVAVYLSPIITRLWEMPVRHRVVAGTIVALVWGGGLALTAAGRRRLHSVGGTGGWSVAEEREAIGLLREGRNQRITDPLITWWTEPARSVATCVFYSRSVVEQVSRSEFHSESLRERYTSNIHSFDEAVGDEPRSILLEKKLVPEIAPEFVYERSASGPSMEMGTIRRRLPSERWSNLRDGVENETQIPFGNDKQRRTKHFYSYQRFALDWLCCGRAAERKR